MIPVSTTDTNDTLRPPGRHPKVEPLPIHREPHCVTSHWQLTNEDVANLKANGGIVSLTILGATHAPVMVAADPSIRRAQPNPANPANHGLAAGQ